MSELARRAVVPLPTVKYYLREGLLPAGRATAVTQAEYDDAHLRRLRLIRALVEVGGLSLAAVKGVVAAVEGGVDLIPVAVGMAHEALPPRTGNEHPARALATMAELGWNVDSASGPLRQLERALRAAEDVGIPAAPDRLRTYADAAMAVARVDVADVPLDSAEDAVIFVVAGTVLYEPILLALRRLAQQHVYGERQKVRRLPRSRAKPRPRAGLPQAVKT